jgi:hypothetical protein
VETFARTETRAETAALSTGIAIEAIVTGVCAK